MTDGPGDAGRGSESEEPGAGGMSGARAGGRDAAAGGAGGVSGSRSAGPISDDEDGPGGPFRSWGQLYATVVVWAISLIVLLYLFTAFLDFGTAP